MKSTKHRGRALSSQTVSKPDKDVIPAMATHRLLLKSIASPQSVRINHCFTPFAFSDTLQDEENSVYTHHLVLTITEDLSSELSDLFCSHWVESTIKFIVSQPVFKWDNHSIINNKVEVLKWLCEFIGT